MTSPARRRYSGCRSRLCPPAQTDCGQSARRRSMSRGVMLTHGNIIWNVYNLLVDVDVRSDEVALVTAPLFHTAALNQVLFPTLLKGGTALIEARFDPDRAISLIEEHGVTLLFGVTSMYLALARSPRWAQARMRTLRSALSGG